MATWLDGPEYAPTVRPREFAEPEVPPLEPAPPRPQPSTDLPTQPPDFNAAAQQDPLAAHGPPLQESRNPREAFSVAATAMTSVDAGPGEQPDPTMPLGPGAPEREHDRQVSAWGSVRRSQVGWPEPQVDWSQPPGGLNFPPPTGPPVQPRPTTASFGSIMKGITPGVAIALVLGCLIYPISPIALAAAAGFSSRVRQAGRSVQMVLVTLTAVAVVWLVATFMLNDLQLGAAWQSTMWLSLVLCWIAALAVFAIVARSIGRGEAPSPAGQ